MTPKQRTLFVLSACFLLAIYIAWVTACVTVKVDCRSWMNMDLKVCREKLLNGDGE